MSGKGWLCPICGTWNPPTAVVCCKTPEHDSPQPGEDD